jgi:hypothetical protein
MLPAACAIILIAGVATGCANRPASGSGSGPAKASPSPVKASPSPAKAAVKAPVKAISRPSTPLWTLSDRGIKTELIMRLKAPPALVVLGGSRALRFQPGFIRRATGLSAFNAAVPHATPEDEWSFVNLFHERFPAARFRFLWIIHCDEFDEFSPEADLLKDPFLSRFLPQSYVDARLNVLGLSADAMLLADARQPSVITPDGFTVWDTLSAAAAKGTLRQRVNGYIKSTLAFYRRTPPQIDPLPSHYFTMTLQLMNEMGAKPTIVLAPLQPWYLAAIYNHGWEARRRLVLAYLHGLQRTYRFNVLDFSRLASIGGSPTGFYDAVHLRPATCRLVVKAVLRALPQAFAPPQAAKA